MSFLVNIISVLKSIGDWWYNAYIEVKSWAWPFNNLATPLYWVTLFFYQLTTLFTSFNDWVSYTADMIASILNWTSIKALIKSWLTGIESVISWFASWASNVTSVINSWWSSVKNTVKGWINDVEDYLWSLINNLSTSFTNLKVQVQTLLDKIPTINEILAWFGDWWGKILANIISWGALTATQIDAVIGSWLKSYAPFWAGWQDVRDNVIGFLSNPLDWIMDKFTDWFLGPE